MRCRHRISKKVFRQLARKNVKKSAKDYFIYFFTLTFAVCLFYTFNSIGEQFTAFGILDTLNFLSAAQGFMIGVSLLVCAIVGFLVVYANRFLMRRRKKEFGIYSVLGMDKRDIGKILMKETILIGFASLGFGILLGILASQGLTMITAKIAGVPVSAYSFVFSIKALGAAVLFFGLTYFCVHLFNVKEMRKMKLLDLLYADRKNEMVREGKKFSGLTGVLAVLLIAAGYFVIIRWSDRKMMESLGAGSLLIGAGTLFLFLFIGNVLIRYLKKRKNFYYRKLNLFAVSQFESRMKSSGVAIAVICIMMYMSVSIMGIGMGLGQSAISTKEKAAPFDVSISFFYDANAKKEQVLQKGIKGYLEEKGSEVLPQLGPEEEVTFYQLKDLTMRQLLGESASGQREVTKILDDSPVWYIGLEDYNRIRNLLGKEPVTLGENEYAFNYNMPDAKSVLEIYQTQEHPIEIGGEKLWMKNNGIYESTLENKNVLSDIGTLIVPQKLTDGGIPVMSILNGMFAGDEDAGNAAFQDDFAKIEYFDYNSRQDIYVEILSNQLIGTYIGSYLGIIFLVTACAVLALQQLTQTEDNRKRYRLLYQMGAGEDAMKKSLLTQMSVCFGLPLGVAAVHAGVILAGVYRDIPYLTAGDVARNILLTVGIAAVLYGVYFMTTYSGSKRILKL
ncbi:MAG: FtsX-like permease family protein [Blautia sp.]|jgi:putative ABC transport system permease protein